MTDPSQWFDRTYWGPEGVQVAKRWGGKAEMGRGARYKDLGPVTDGQKGAIRKITTGRKARGMASDKV